MAKRALTVAGFVFLVVSLFHVSRVIFKFDLIIGETPIPIWVNGAGFILAMALSYWMFKTSRK